jgi:carbamoyl-phosphate synthase large subunit
VNVLVTAAGRRTSLVREFVDEVHKRGGRVYAGDIDPLAPALYLADEAIRTLRTDDPGYIADLIATSARLEIALLIPTIDAELSVLAGREAAFGAVGCRIAISSESFVRLTLDKYETGRRFRDAGIRVPDAWLPDLARTTSLPRRVFVKPRRGSSSHLAYAIESDRLDAVLRLVPDAIVQEVLTGPEITIDALLDFDHQLIHYVPRRRIRTMGGESVQGVTLEHDSELEDWIERILQLSSSWGAAGPLTMQAFLTSDGPVLTEINARFGGGIPLAFAAGACYPAWLLTMVEGQPVAPRLREYEPGLFMTRYNTETFTRQPKW